MDTYLRSPSKIQPTEEKFEKWKAPSGNRCNQSHFDSSTHFMDLADLGKGDAKVRLYDVNGKLDDVMLSNELYIPSYNHKYFQVHINSKVFKV